MSKFIGRLVKLGVAKEANRGEGAAPVYHIPRTTLTFDDKVVKARSIGSLGNLADSEEAFVTTKYGQGDVEGEIRDKSFGLFLYAMLGACSSSTPAVDSAYTHSFTISQSNQHQSLSFVVTDENTTELYKLVMLDSLEITAALDQIVKFNAGFMSKCSRDTGLTVPAVIAEHKFTKKHLLIRLADTIGAITGEGLSLKSLTLKISKNVSLDDSLGTAEPEDILNRQLAVEGTMTLNYEDEIFKNYMKNANSKAMEIAFIDTDDALGVAVTPTNPSLTIQLPKVDFFNWEPVYGLEEIVTQKISFKASRNVASAQEIIHLCQLVNGVASY